MTHKDLKTIIQQLLLMFYTLKKNKTFKNNNSKQRKRWIALFCREKIIFVFTWNKFEKR